VHGAHRAVDVAMTGGTGRSDGREGLAEVG
jgi:hypothetical protein